MNSLKYIIIPFLIAIFSQIVKTIIETIKYKKINISRLFDGMGGMPSTHSSLVASITTLIYLNYGITSSLFSISLIFSLIVIYDSMGIRYESGKQAEVINNFTWRLAALLFLLQYVKGPCKIPPFSHDY